MGWYRKYFDAKGRIRWIRVMTAVSWIYLVMPLPLIKGTTWIV